MLMGWLKRGGDGLVDADGLVDDNELAVESR